jgi:hypothetical protein
MTNILKMSNAGGFKTLTRYPDMLAGNTTWNPWEPAGAYESIGAVTVPSGGVSSITFSGIPQTYAHLQVRYIARATGGSSTASVYAWFNNDTTLGNSPSHFLQGNGSSASAGARTGGSFGNIQIPSAITGTSGLANSFGVGIIEILDYANTNKYKTTRALAGNDQNGSGIVDLMSGVFTTNTNAVNRIDLGADGNFAELSSFALYGIKG